MMGIDSRKILPALDISNASPSLGASISGDLEALRMLRDAISLALADGQGYAAWRTDENSPRWYQVEIYCRGVGNGD